MIDVPFSVFVMQFLRSESEKWEDLGSDYYRLAKPEAVSRLQGWLSGARSEGGIAYRGRVVHVVGRTVWAGTGIENTLDEEPLDPGVLILIGRTADRFGGLMPSLIHYGPALVRMGLAERREAIGASGQWYYLKEKKV